MDVRQEEDRLLLNNHDNEPLEIEDGSKTSSEPNSPASMLSRKRNTSGILKVSQNYPHIFRRKSPWELVILTAAVCGIELCYAAETAFITPILLNLGIDVKFMTLVWCLSPFIGFFLTPILGSLSDTCTLKFGRRRPFILILSLGIVFGLIFVPNGQYFGELLGDEPVRGTNSTLVADIDSQDASSRPWGIVMTIIGIVILDFCSDASQSPSRSYLLDVTVPEDHPRGLSMFTLMAGLGGFAGYVIGGVDWESVFPSGILSNQVRTTFTIIAALFFVCIAVTVTSFKEMPLNVILEKKLLESTSRTPGSKKKEGKKVKWTPDVKSYGSTDSKDSDYLKSSEMSEPDSGRGSTETHPEVQVACLEEAAAPEVQIREHPTLVEYLKSIVFMPNSIRILCLTSFLCWMSDLCYSLYFTDFVGQAVFGGDPKAPPGSDGFKKYQEGIRFGCWGLASYTLTCSLYSIAIETLVVMFGAKLVYIFSMLTCTVGMILMSTIRHKICVILLSPTAGIMYAALLTMPYLLISHYHHKETFHESLEGKDIVSKQQVRGIGTDVAVISSMIFMAQFFLSLFMGSVIDAVGSTLVTVSAAGILSACAALCATQIMYLDL